MLMKRLAAFVTALIGLSFSALAQGVGQPVEKGVTLQAPVNELARNLNDFHDMLLWIIVAITIFVFILLAVVVLKFNSKANPKPSTTTHNTVLEVIWTAVPVLILIVIAVPSVRLLYFQDQIPETEFAVRITGNQWNWTYAYPDHGGIEFTSVIVPDDAFKSGSMPLNAQVRADAEQELSDHMGYPIKMGEKTRNLETNTRLVVPVNTKVRIELTASDVIHAWTIPSFGVKLDAVPGRLNDTWFEVDQIGTYYGQCSELCGKDHAFMPIAVEVVSKEAFAKWVEHAKGLYAAAPVKPTTALGR